MGNYLNFEASSIVLLLHFKLLITVNYLISKNIIIMS